MKRIFLALIFCLAALPAAAGNFSNWAVVIIAGDDHSHSGAQSQVFDNARRDLARAFANIGFNPNNITQFSVEPEKDAQQTDATDITNGMWDTTGRAPGGCLIYYTSHGTPTGIVMNGGIMTPENWGHVVSNACGTKPAVIVMSACFSGQFVPALAQPNRMVFTAARPDRTSFGCGDDDHYTFFDGCFLQSLPGSGNFPDLAQQTIGCVSKLESQLGVDYPSEPQLFIGKDVVSQLSWR
jgi:hypothetical protein